MGHSQYWVGILKSTGAIYVYDPEVAHPNKTKIFAYSISQKKMKEYERSTARSALASVEDARKDSAIQDYSRWKKLHLQSFLAEIERLRMAEKEAFLERHRQRLIGMGFTYSGVITGSQKQHRVTHCYACKNHLDNTIDIECKACGWIICKCGACGCGYER